MTTPNFMYNTEIRQNTVGGGNSWAPLTDYWWPGADYNVRFFAYAPYNLTSATLSDSTTEGAPTLTYTNPTDYTQQVDLLGASTEALPGNYAYAVNFAFGHALTAIHFVASKDMLAGTISGITLKNIYRKGTCNLADNTWSDLADKSDFALTFDTAIEIDGTADVALTSDEQTLLMIPQTLASDATVEVAFTDKLTNTARTLTFNLADATWQAGKGITYRLSTQEISITPTFTVTVPSAVKYTGGNTTYQVTSYTSIAQTGTETQQKPATWSVKFYDYNDTTKEYDVALNGQPDWITAFTTSGDGSTSAVSYTATVAAQTGVEVGHTAILQGTTARGTASAPYDLAMYTVDNQPQTGLTTANCYVVSAPGYYALPLVYGNAVKNGKTNEVSYHPGGTASSTFATTFVNHLDADITAPCLEDNANVAPATAELLWNDASADFIAVDETLTAKSVTLDGTTKSIKYLTFQIPQASIKQGNAVIAVKDASGTILWSWHIWVTDDNISNTKAVTNYMGEVNDMMTENLGYCDGPTKAYAERSVKVVFTQDDTNETQSFILTQKGDEIAELGNDPYYQWGRKDVFLAALAASGSNTRKTAYNASGVITTEAYSHEENTTVTIGMDIQNPTVHYNSASDIYGPCKTYYYNMWSAKSTRKWEHNEDYNTADELVIKTIYDPCPAGFHVAPANAFSGFNTTGQSSTVASTFNVSGSFSGGYFFYCNASEGDAGDTIFIPASGYINRDGAIDGITGYVGKCGYSWCAVAGLKDRGRNLDFYNGNVSPTSYNWRAVGYAIRPVKEKAGE
jgi:hypothetical protein